MEREFETKEFNPVLTKEQVENWRRVLFGTLGPFALIMPDEMIQKYRDMMQQKADNFAAKKGGDTRS